MCIYVNRKEEEDGETRAMLFLTTCSFVAKRRIVAMSIKSRRPSMKVKENLEMEEQLQLVETVLYSLHC